MGTSIGTIKRWFEEGKAAKKTHLLVVCDGFDWDDYPIYADSPQNCTEIFEAHHHKNMQKVMEVYDLSKPWDASRTGIVWELPK